MSSPLLFTRSGRQSSQQPDELFQFIDLLHQNKVRSYLEIGARHGDTFYTVAKSLPAGSRVVAVDMPDGPWGSSWSKECLCECISELKTDDYDAHCIFGNSGDQSVIDAVSAHGKFDAVFIDGDHRYEAVKRDFVNYRGKITAFHDIDGDGIFLRDMEVQVPKLWSEIKQQYRHIEFINPADSRRMGIGVIFE